MKRTTLLTAALAIAVILAASPALAMRDPGAGAIPGTGMPLYQYGAPVPGRAPAPAYMPVGPARTGMALYNYGVRRPVAASAMPYRPHLAPPRIGQTGLNGQYQDGMNLYQYVGSNPLAYVDPSGLFRQYICCDQHQINTIKQDEARALGQIQALRGQINAAIAADQGQYPALMGMALRTSLRYLDTASGVIQNYKVKCERKGASRKCEKGSPAWVKWIFARTVHLCPRHPNYSTYFTRGPRNRASLLVHEGTHVGGTLDITYFLTRGERPHRVCLTGWQDIASTYDTWILYGFCIPGHDCHRLGPYVWNTQE